MRRCAQGGVAFQRELCVLVGARDVVQMKLHHCKREGRVRITQNNLQLRVDMSDAAGVLLASTPIGG